MKLNRTIIFGLLCILLGGLIFITDIFNPIIRPVTHLFLMGSSKGKDILFFGLFGIFLILSQVVKKDVDSTKYLKITIGLGSLLLVLGIVLEVIFRLQMGIKLNTIFCSMTGTMSSTSILHTHLLKSILGAVITPIMGPLVQSGINTGVGLYAYVPSFAFLIILIMPVLFITIILASQDRPWFTNFIMAFSASCLFIGAIDGGFFGTPALVGILGFYYVYRSGYLTNLAVGHILKDEQLIEKNEEIPPLYSCVDMSKIRFFFNLILIWIVVLAVILLRFTVAFAGAEADYYTVDVVNPTDNIDLGNISTHVIDVQNSTNKITYHIEPNYNEMQLLNDLKVPLNNSCEYYTVSWNIYSYLQDD